MSKINPNSKIDVDKVTKNLQESSANYQNWLAGNKNAGASVSFDFYNTYRDPDLTGNKSVSVNPITNVPTAGQPKYPQQTTPAAQDKKPSGGGGSTYTVNAGNQPYVDQLNSLYDQIVNRKPFQYDLNGDLLYRQMADRYTQLGQQAMRDTMGQAAALTGGYGNSYANQVGNQAYQQYMTALNDNVPQLWDRAYQAYMNEGDQLMQKYELTAAHPGYVEAISPRTYTVTPPKEEEDDPPAGNQSAYDLALMSAGLLPGRAGAGTTNPFVNYYYGLLTEEQKKK